MVIDEHNSRENEHIAKDRCEGAGTEKSEAQHP